MNQQIHRVYLDTNIIIEGPKRQEHRNLIELALKGLFKLFIGDEVSTELRKRSYNLRRIKTKLFRGKKRNTARNNL